MLATIASMVTVGLLVFSSSGHAYPQTPMPEVTPGALCDESDPDFDHYRYGARIPYCKRDVDRSLKQRVYDTYKIPQRCRGSYTVDHLIPLSIGGNNSFENLWPEHRDLKATRPYLEQEVFEGVSRGTMTQEQAVSLILEEKFNPDIQQLRFELLNRSCD